MGQANSVFRLSGTGPASPLPTEVQNLCPRMREIAAIVYLSGAATTRDVQAKIEDPLTVYGIRTMLNRLAKKGIVARRRSGFHSEIVYLPAILTERVREVALKRFIERNFDSSVSSALQSTLRLVTLEQPRHSAAPPSGRAAAPRP